jgi:hypothetical protein
LNELRERYNFVAVRVAAAKTGVRNMEQRLARQGLALRGDIIAAESRVDYLMKEAMDSIRSGDVANGRRNLQMAEGNLATLEKFLGQ